MEELSSVKRYVLGFCFNTSLNKVALILKKRPTWQAGRLNGIGGHIEPGETPKQAMEREFVEETDYKEPVLQWSSFGRLRGLGWEVWLFHGVANPANTIWKDGPEGLVSMHHVSSALSGESKGFPTLPNLRWLIPMAMSHATGEDSAEFFDIKETKLRQGLPL